MSASIPATDAEAIRKYGRDWQRSQADGLRAEKRLEASQALASARRALSPTEAALLDMTAGRGYGLADVARKAGRNRGDMEELFLSAGRKLAVHYQAKGDDEA